MPATTQVIQPALRPSRLRIGETMDNVSLQAPVDLQVRGLAAHTAIIAQSGAGKSFMLGRYLEELAARTRARLLILDPNSDFVRFDKLKDPFPTIPPHDENPLGFKVAWGRIAFGILSQRPSPNAVPPSGRISMSSTVSKAWLASMLEISARTRHAFNTIWPSGDFLKLSDVKNRIDQNGMFNFPERPEFEIYARLLELLECDLWDKSNSLEGLIGQFFQPNPSSRVICLDLGSLDRERQALLVAEAALDSLWTSARSAWNAAIARPRDEDTRCPVFVVIDEAHNLAPEQASSRTSGRVTEILTRIAMEGRKYGLFLILATQRPSRLSANLLSQCDNLVLMKMSNPADVALVKERFGFISTNSAARALAFEQGQMILAGRFVENELAVSVFPRRTMEGGRSLRDESWLLESEGEQ